MVGQLIEMWQQPKAKQHRCNRCGEAFTNMTRVEHHMAAEHTLRRARDIRTTRHITHRPQTSLGTADGHRA